MSLSSISSSAFLASQNPILFALKIGAITSAINAIQILGILAEDSMDSCSNPTDSEAKYWQYRYLEHVDFNNHQKDREFQWIMPKTKEDWHALGRMHTHLMIAKIQCDVLYFADSPLNPRWWEATEKDRLASQTMKNFFCSKVYSYYTFYDTLLKCEHGNLVKCIISNSETHEIAIAALAEEIKTVLPNNAQESKYIPVQDCFSSTCPDIDIQTVHRRERAAAETAYTASPPLESTREKLTNWFASKFIPPEWSDVQEVLRFRKDDPREKFLLASAEIDHNGALEPELIAGILSKLSQKFDLKYQVFKSPQDMCKTIEKAKKMGNLAFVMIEGHGNSRGIVFDAEKVMLNGEEIWNNYVQLEENSDFSQCFSGLEANGKILLMSCSTGGGQNGRPFDNIAQSMANTAKRVVVAPKNSSYPTKVSFLSIDDGVLYEPENTLYSFSPFYQTNIYNSFRPVFKNCFPEINIKSIHERESSVMEVIKTDLVSKSLLHKDEPPGRAHEYLQICRDDPRKKILFFVAEHDKNGALDPKLTTSIFSLFADRFDLQYKVVKSPSEICQGIDLAIKAGTIANVFILAHGTNDGGMILSKDSTKEVHLKASDELIKCLSKIEEDGTIVLMGGSLGQKSDSENNIPKKIAKDSKRTVIATTCPVFPNDTKIKSLIPLIMEHPQYSSLYNFFIMRCPENKENHFKTFTP